MVIPLRAVLGGGFEFVGMVMMISGLSGGDDISIAFLLSSSSSETYAGILNKVAK